MNYKYVPANARFRDLAKPVFTNLILVILKFILTGYVSIDYYEHNIANNSIIGPTSLPEKEETFLFTPGWNLKLSFD